MLPIDKVFHVLKRSIFPKINSSVLLLLAGIIAIIIANTPLYSSYKEFLHYPLQLRLGGYSILSHHGQTMTVSQFVNDALMAIFFFLVGLEIKQELLVGELSSAKKALLPVIAALGGMIVPVLCFFAICHQHPNSLGAAIPMATDIAFALAVLSVLGNRVPYSLRIFLTALAVVDDIGGIIVIAVFYSQHVAYLYLLIAIGVLLLIYIIGKLGMHSSFFYYFMGVIVWMLFLKSGIHPTIAGVLVALCTPARTKIKIGNLQEELRKLFEALPKEQQRESGSVLVLSHSQLSIVNDIRQTTRHAISPVQIIENDLLPIVNYLILPLFAFVNAGINLGDISPDGLLGVPLAVTLGLFPGKAIGIFVFVYLAIKTRICTFPKGMTVKNMAALSIFGGVGFTVSLFIANLSYGTTELSPILSQAKLGVFIGTIVSAIVGIILLRRVLNAEHRN